MISENPRELRGLAILAMGNQIKRLNASTYRVQSQNGNGSYLVIKEGREWKCECPDHVYRSVVCKHIYTVHFSLNLRQRVTSRNLGFEDLCEPETSCKYCGSTKIIKSGQRKNKKGVAQRFLCKECGRRFIVDSGFENMKNNPKIITLALDLYFKGVSLRKITDHLKQFYGKEVSHVAVYKWIQKYSRVMNEYVDQYQPQVSGIWNTDEMTLNIKGEFDWLWNLMDRETRFLLASQISKRRKVADARRVFAKGKEVSGTVPDFMVTDGLQAYTKAFNKEFYTMRRPRPQHVRLAGIAKRANNNVVERINGTIRERNKVMRGLKSEESAQAIIDGFRVYYNFIRPHTSLNGKTPAEAAGIDLGLNENKWMNLIKKSTSKESSN